MHLARRVLLPDTDAGHPSSRPSATRSEPGDAHTESCERRHRLGMARPATRRPTHHRLGRDPRARNITTPPAILWTTERRAEFGDRADPVPWDALRRRSQRV